MNAIELAIKMENDAVDFYREAAMKAKHSAAKVLFRAIVEDELKHLDMLTRIFTDVDITVDDIGPVADTKTIFETMKAEVLQEAELTADAADVFRIAAEMEQKGLDFYEKAEADAVTEKEKKLFRRLAVEEKEHLELFSNTYSFLMNNRGLL